MGTAAFVLYAASIYLALPCALVWGWVRWGRGKKCWSLIPVLSLIGFAFATASALLAVGARLYGLSIGGWPYYDPRLMRVYFWGSVLSISASVFGLGGVWRKGSLRWHGAACALGTLIFWIFQAASE